MSYLTNEQRSHNEWVESQKCEFIFQATLSQIEQPVTYESLSFEERLLKATKLKIDANLLTRINDHEILTVISLK